MASTYCCSALCADVNGDLISLLRGLLSAGAPSWVCFLPADLRMSLCSCKTLLYFYSAKQFLCLPGQRFPTEGSKAQTSFLCREESFTVCQCLTLSEPYNFLAHCEQPADPMSPFTGSPFLIAQGYFAESSTIFHP